MATLNFQKRGATVNNVLFKRLNQLEHSRYQIELKTDHLYYLRYDQGRTNRSQKIEKLLFGLKFTLNSFYLGKRCIQQCAYGNNR